MWFHNKRVSDSWLINLGNQSSGPFFQFGSATLAASSDSITGVCSWSIGRTVYSEAPGRGFLMSRRGVEDTEDDETCPCTTSPLAGWWMTRQSQAGDRSSHSQWRCWVFSQRAHCLAVWATILVFLRPFSCCSAAQTADWWPADLLWARLHLMRGVWVSWWNFLAGGQQWVLRFDRGGAAAGEDGLT